MIYIKVINVPVIGMYQYLPKFYFSDSVQNINQSGMISSGFLLPWVLKGSIPERIPRGPFFFLIYIKEQERQHCLLIKAKHIITSSSSGNGWYNIGLLITLSITLLSAGLDLLSFSVVVAYSSCDFHLSLVQKSILVSIPFTGKSVFRILLCHYCSNNLIKLSQLTLII